MRQLSFALLLVLAAATAAFGFGDNDQGIVTANMVTVIKTPTSIPAVDSHVHLAATPEMYELAIKAMDAGNIAMSINLSGGNGETLKRNVELAKQYPARFLQFCSVGGRGADWNAPDIGEIFASQLEEAHALGAVGFGEVVKWSLSRRIAWDDPRLDPMWQKLVDLKMPINWHVGDPSRYWRPESPYNTLESDSYYKRMPLKQELLNQQERVLERYPDLIVIAAHSNYLADQIPLLVYRFEKYPNYYIDLSATIGEWGRVPEEFIDICRDYSDRIFYGTDAGYRGDAIARAGSLEQAVANLGAVHVATHLFLSTDQRMIPIPWNGNYGRYLTHFENGFTRYAHDGVELPDEILEKIYYKNVEKLFGVKIEGWTPPQRAAAASAE